MTTVVIGVVTYLVGWATAAAFALGKESDLEAEIRRLTIELRDARVNRRTWQ